MPSRRKYSMYDRAQEITRAVIAGGDFSQLTGIELHHQPSLAGIRQLTPDCVGIWCRVREQGKQYAYERSRHFSSEWHLWADVDRIPPRSERKRVVLIGESTARGYFYDPEFTPAIVLEAMLQTAGLPQGVEVIDLARSDLAVEGELPRLFQSSACLEPDLVIVFAGNNRILPYDILTDSAGKQTLLANRLRRDGVAGISEISADWRKAEISRLVTSLAESSCPVLYVIPEFNLADWRCETSGDAPWFRQYENQRWFALLDQALKAERRGDSSVAEKLALQMVAIDQGTASQGAQILANYYRHRNSTKAYHYAKQARDAHIGWDFGSPDTPRLDEIAKSTLKDRLTAAGIEYVDCGSLYADYLGQDLVDRRLFLDYCHLTELGINLTMAATASKVLKFLGEANFSTEMLHKTISVKAGKKVSAQAHFAAAIHNAHWGQPADLVDYHIQTALRDYPDMAGMCESYLEMISSRVPNWAHKNMNQLLSSQYDSLVKYIAGYGSGSLMDTILGTALATALDSHKKGVLHRWKNMRQQEYGLCAGKPEDLLHPAYAPAYMDREWAHSGAGGAIQSSHAPVVQFMAHAPRSAFSWVCRGDTAVKLDITCRCQDIDTSSSDMHLDVIVNEHIVAQMRVSKSWQRTQIMIPASVLIDGLNALVLYWPEKLISAEAALEQIAEKTQQRMGSARFSPIYGRIYSLTATLAVDSTSK